MGSPVVGSQTRVSPSSDPVATRFPSREKATESTAFSCPPSVKSGAESVTCAPAPTSTARPSISPRLIPIDASRPYGSREQFAPLTSSLEVGDPVTSADGPPFLAYRRHLNRRSPIWHNYGSGRPYSARRKYVWQQ